MASLGRYGKESIEALNSHKSPGKFQTELEYGNMRFIFTPTRVIIQSQDKSLIGTIYGYFPLSESHSVKAVPVPPDYEIDGNLYRPEYAE